MIAHKSSEYKNPAQQNTILCELDEPQSLEHINSVQQNTISCEPFETINWTPLKYWFAPNPILYMPAYIYSSDYIDESMMKPL